MSICLVASVFLLGLLGVCVHGLVVRLLLTASQLRLASPD